MKKLFSVIPLLMLSWCTEAQPPVKKVVPQKNSIALLGTYHFNNPNQDHFNVNSDDVLSAKRQAEITKLVSKLATYKPTHIALEFNATDTAADARYQRYVEGKHTLNNTELEQIGFRLAKMLGHPHIYPVDAPDIQLDFDPGELAADYGSLLEQLGKTGDSVMKTINSWVSQYSISGVLSRLNSKEMDRLNVQLYYQFLLPIGKDSNQPGAEAVARWHKRNLYILHHIMKLTEGKDNQRVLVIFGQGHTAMLKEFLNASPIFEVKDIHQFLPVK